MSSDKVRCLDRCQVTTKMKNIPRRSQLRRKLPQTGPKIIKIHCAESSSRPSLGAGSLEIGSGSATCSRHLEMYLRPSCQLPSKHFLW